jgi:alanyl-tRNA synthetase
VKAQEIRQTFFAFFQSKQHQVVSSAPMVIKNDPSLMFTNAGMNQFKDWFLGNAPAQWKRVANTQKCLRVSGKHNDLEEVGHDTYHHTMFEMLGNWSFGDYFKEEAIQWAWELLVHTFGLLPDRLYATVFEGSKEFGLDKDSKSFACWERYLPQEHIIYGNKKDNFWEMGDTGPCGPCSEIHIDLRQDAERTKIPGQALVNKNHPKVIELWNLVFIEFHRKSNDKLEELPQKHVDTGMGLERLCMVLQGKNATYDTDILQQLITAVGKKCHKKYGKNEQVDIAMRVVSDHLRSIAFAIADGQLPSNNGAGYVIRRILRRALRYGFSFLDLKQPFMHELVEALKNTMGETFPELVSQQLLIAKVIKEEEESFLHTLEVGMKILDTKIAQLKKEGKDELHGNEAFVLYDTFGFPLDLTELILRENKLKVNQHEFCIAMEKQKSRSRKAAAQETSDWLNLKKTEKTTFVGYESLNARIQITRYRRVKQKNQILYQLIFNQTPFYPASGGQVGDTGYIEGGGKKINILDTQKEHDLTVHLVNELPDDPSIVFTAVVNAKRRRLTTNNHTATHLLHYALREILGKHVEQKGSLVHPTYLRFDFSHFQKVGNEELIQIQCRVNELIRENKPQEEKHNISFAKARSMGAIALFGEKYGTQVRVIQFGNSIELCGGTHAPATGQLGYFLITSESAIAAGIRRIEAITADTAEAYLNKEMDSLHKIKNLLHHPVSLTKSIENLLAENDRFKKQMENFQQNVVVEIKKKLKQKIQHLHGINIIAEKIDLDSVHSMKSLSFQLKNEVDRLFLVLGAEVNGKPMLSVLIADTLIQEKNWHAGKIIREVAKKIQGNGGGQPFYATAGGKDLSGLNAAIQQAKELVQERC